MNARRFFVPRTAISGTTLSIEGPEAHHIAVVLRLQHGDHIVAFDGTGQEYDVQLERVSAPEVTGRILAARAGQVSALYLALLQGVTKGAKMDDVIRMGTEVGVAEFIPFLSQRTVAEGRQRAVRWRRIATEAAKQSRRSAVPVVHDPAPLQDALQKLSRYDLVLVLWEGERSRSIRDLLEGVDHASRIAIIVGPEGGLEPREVELTVKAGGVPVTLGPLILRTETAGIVALSMVRFALSLRSDAGRGRPEVFVE